MNIGKVFKEERERLNVSQRKMAELLCITPAALWKIESGRNFPKQKTIEKFCAEAGLPMAYFYQQAMTIEDYRLTPNGIIAPGTPVLRTESGQIFPV